MIHARKDYDAIQPFPTKRPHHVKVWDSAREDDPDNAWDLVMDIPDEVAELEASCDNAPQPIIPDDEPVFLIRAKDVIGVEIVFEYVSRLKDEIGEDSEMVQAIRKHAQAMEDYAAQRYNGGKVPDVPDGMLRR